MNARIPTLAVSTILLLNALSCSSPGPELIETSGSKEPVAAQATLRLEEVAREAGQVTLRLVNRTDAPLVFRGYGPNAPLYAIEVERDGGWEPEILGWCGTGLGRQELEPGAEARFGVILREDPIRIRLALHAGGGGSFEVWSDALSAH